MTIGEFKAFLEGMDIKEAPTKEQWKKIQSKIDKLHVLSETKVPMYPDRWADRIYNDPKDGIAYLSA